MEQRSPDEIWSDDLLGRKVEAEMLAAYIESVVGRAVLREDVRAYTIAVDGGYGEGKSFFLRRFAKHLSVNHPVAHIDAWADDLNDEPLTALAATLKDALAPLIKKRGPLKTQWTKFAGKTGKVLKIAAEGLVKRGVGLAITPVAAEALASALAGADEDVEEAIKEDLKGVGKEAVAGAATAMKEASSSAVLNERIAAFERSKAAVQEMKDSLAAIVQALPAEGMMPPIVIVIDELDRCRPTYALKLLEEVKHLFDVPGLVFVFGMHGEQLAHSVCAAYGAGFDGAAYLSRFINRRYRLRTPDLAPLVNKLMASTSIPPERLYFYRVNNGDAGRTNEARIARYMKLYGLGARDAFRVIDIVETCAALTQQDELSMDYLLPALISRLKGAPPRTLLPFTDDDVDYMLYTGGGFKEQVKPWDLVRRLHDLFLRSTDELRAAVNTQRDAVATLAGHDRSSSRSRLGDPANYSELLDAVGRFKNPQMESRG